MTALTGTLSRYLARQFTFWLLSVFCILTAIIEIFDAVELLRRASGKQDVGFGVLIQMALAKLPHLVQDLLPFVVLFGGMVAYWRMAKSSELVIARAAGVSIWQILAPAVVIACIVCIFQITAFSPFATSMRTRYEVLEARHLSGNGDQLAVSRTGLWLRQGVNDQQAVIHAERVAQSGTELFNVTVYQMEGEDRFKGRIDAERALLRRNHWELQNAAVSDSDGLTRQVELHRIPTKLTLDKIQDSFASADSLSFWELPDFIKTLEDAGFDATSHRLRFHAMLATPLLFCAMVLIAATFSIRASRRSSTGYMILGGIGCGFLLYLLTNVVHALGLSTNIPTALAAWMPAGVSTMLGVTALLHLEDG